MAFVFDEFYGSVPAHIFQRGKDYFSMGWVGALRRDGNGFSATVQGSGTLYQTSVVLSDDGYPEAWDCTCPYDYGPVCKHLVALLLSIEDEDMTEAQPSRSLLALVQKVDIDVLRRIVLEQAEKDQDFYAHVRLQLQSDVQEIFSQSKAVLQQAIRNNRYRGDIDQKGCHAICIQMDRITEKAMEQLTKKQYVVTLELCLYVLQSAVELAMEADTSSGYWIDTVDGAIQGISHLAIQVLTQKEDENLVERMLVMALQTVKMNAFDDFDEERFEILKAITPLVTDKTLPLALESIGTFWESSTSYVQELYMETQYHFLQSAYGEKEANVYLQAHLEVDALREIAVENAVIMEDYSRAKALCEEKTKQVKDARKVIPWMERLYQIHQLDGSLGAQMEMARCLLLLGLSEYFDVLKCQYKSQGCWCQKKPDLMAEIAAKLNPYAAMGILEKEKEWSLLLPLVEKHSCEIFQYGHGLWAHFPQSIEPLVTKEITQRMVFATDRKAYARLCTQLKKVASWGATSLVIQLIAHLQQEYPRRPALLEELQKIEYLLS